MLKSKEKWREILCPKELRNHLGAFIKKCGKNIGNMWQNKCGKQKGQTMLQNNGQKNVAKNIAKTCGKQMWQHKKQKQG